MKKIKVRDSIAEVVYAFRNLTDKTAISDDNGWSPREIYYFLLKYRSRLLREKKNITGRLSEFNYQTTCLELDSIDQSESPCTPASGCKFLKTVIPVPQTIGNIKTVTDTIGKENIPYVEWDKFKYKVNSRIKAQNDKPYYTLKNIGEGTYLYIHNKKFLKSITVTAMFEDPLAVQLLPDCKGDASKYECAYYPELDFIMDPDLVSTMFDLIISQIGKAKFPSTDLFNNNNDDIVNNKQNVK